MALLNLALPQVPLTLPENSILPLPTIGIDLLGLPLLSAGLTGPDADKFTLVNLGLGQVQVQPLVPFDYEVRGGTPFELGIKVTLLGGLELISAPFTVALTDVNDVAPSNIRLSNNRQIPENLPGATIGTLLADDPDTVNSPIVFSIAGGADAGLFEIATDGVSLKLRDGIALDYELKEVYEVLVTAFDGVNTSVATALSISAVDWDDGAGLPIPIVGLRVTTCLQERPAVT
jgi:hypothetical protein